MDWPLTYPTCQGNYQSPIDLKSEINSNKFPTVYIQNEFLKSYHDVQNLEIEWVANSSVKVYVEDVNANPKTQFFVSDYMES